MAQELVNSIHLILTGLSQPPLAPHQSSGQYQTNREDVNCIKQANESSALPIFIFMVAQVTTSSIFAYHRNENFNPYCPKSYTVSKIFLKLIYSFCWDVEDLHCLLWEQHILTTT